MHLKGINSVWYGKIFKIRQIPPGLSLKKDNLYLLETSESISKLSECTSLMPVIKIPLFSISETVTLKRLVTF